MQPPRRFLSALLTVCAVVSLRAQIVYDTVSVRTVGPGMTHYHVVAPSVPWSINVLTVDLRNPYVSLETVKANNRLAGRETVRAMAQRRSSAGHVIVGAVNGDFYDGVGAPITVQVAQGEIVRMPVTRPGVGFSIDNKPVAGNVTFSGSVVLPDTIATLHGVNATRNTDQLILYNPYFGTSTGTNQYGTEVRVRPLTPWIVNDTVLCAIEEVQTGAGGMALNPGEAVLSGHGLSSSMVLSRLAVSDTLRVVQKLSPAVHRLTEMIGGYPKLVVGSSTNAFAAPREPRTAAGFSADSGTLYLFTVDGRQGELSVGMTFEELADFMILSGVGEGVNLDGGGSTTMIIRDEVMNSPSDGSERAVSNALLIVSSAPSGPLSTTAINPKSVRVFRGGTATFSAVGFDTLGNPAATEPGVARFFCDAGIGTIDSVTGSFAAGPAAAGGWVRMSYNGQWDSAAVVVKSAQHIIISPRDVVTDSSRVIQYRVQTVDVDGLTQSVPLTAYTWEVSDASVGSVSSDGKFKGSGSGTARIRVRLDDVKDSATVRVQLRSGSTVLDSLESVGGYYSVGSGVDVFGVSASDSFFTTGSRSVRLEYSFVGSASTISYIYMYTNMLLFGVPDSIVIHGRSGLHQHRLYYLVEDDDGEEFRLYSSKLLQPSGSWEDIRAPFFPNQEVVPGSDFQFPVRIKRIEVQLVYNRQAGVTYNGSLFLDNLRVVYPDKTVTHVLSGGNSVPEDMRLLPNFPNPFNPSTTFSFSLPQSDLVSLRVYDLRGRLVRTLLEKAEVQSGTTAVHWDGRTDRGHPTASGLYIVRLVGSHSIATQKALLLK